MRTVLDPTGTACAAPTSDAALQGYLAEYNELCQNVRDRVQLEQSILNYSAVIIAALVPASSAIIEHQNIELFFFIPPIFVVLALLVMRQDLLVTAIAGYMNMSLRPALRRACQDNSAFRVDDALFELRRTLGYAVVGTARYSLFAFPCVASLLALPYLKSRMHIAWTPVDSWATAADFALLLSVSVWIGWATGRAYLRTRSRLVLTNDGS